MRELETVVGGGGEFKAKGAVWRELCIRDDHAKANLA